MASIQRRPSKDGKSHKWRAVIRVRDYPTICKTFDRKQEAEDWGNHTEREIKRGRFRFDFHNTTRTFQDLVNRFINDGCLEHHRSSKDTLRHVQYWNQKFGSYGLVHITSEMIGKERKLLLNTPTVKGRQESFRSPATVNRYISSLSSILSYAKNLKWIDENPCFSLKKLREPSGRERVFSMNEITRLLSVCKEASNRYLYAIVLIAITSGARKGEILSLEWSDINFENKIAYLRQTKNNQPRCIPLVDEIIQELKTLFQNKPSQQDLIFASKTAFGHIDIKKSWKQALMKANIENCRFHDLRHTFCTMAAAQGASSLELSTATGHRTLQMLQRYTHLDASLTEKFSNNISKQILNGDAL